MIETAVPWISLEPDIVNPIRNTNQTYLKFVNSVVFSEEARHFLKHGYYTSAPIGSKDYNDYWDEQEDRCLNGYSVGGVRVTGRHYYYLNFCQIKARPIDLKTGRESADRKIITFPRFLDHNYYWFNEIEECLAEGPHVDKRKQGHISLKSRRKGFSFQISGGIYSYNYNFIEHSSNILAAYEKGHYKAILDGIHFSINHINKHTDWAKRRGVLNKRDHFRASFKQTDNTGVEVEDGYMSEIQAISFKDNPFKAIGASVDIMGYEECGKFLHLLTAYTISEPMFRDGDVMTGVPILWGTSGDMESGTKDFAEMFMNPAPYGLKAYENIYDENAAGDCGWFIDDMWYYPGTIKKEVYVDGKKKEQEFYLVDTNGNSIRNLAEESLDKKRKERIKGSRAAYRKFLTQQPKTPKEALIRTDGSNPFDTMRAESRLSHILTNQKKFIDSIWKANLQPDIDNNKIIFTYDKDNEALHEFPLKDNKGKPGTIEIYEMPVFNSEGKIPGRRYIGGLDPFDDDASETNSVGSCFILDLWTDRIVAHYKGRPSANKFYENVRRLLKFYNAIANYERRNKGIYGYFYNHNCLHLLCEEPEILKEKEISKANTIGNNSKGTNPGVMVNQVGREWYAKWCSERAYGEPEDSEVTNLDKVRSIGLLKETIAWDADGNYDDISAMIMLMIYREELVKYTKSERQEETKALAEDPFWQSLMKVPKSHTGGNYTLSGLDNMFTFTS